MKEYKSIIISLIRFFFVYLVLTGLYYLYLDHYQNNLQTCDPFTELVAKQSSAFLNRLGFSSEVSQYDKENYMRFSINKEYISITNEGCNALSVMIMYISFIIAFASTRKKTAFFLIFTLILIHFFNIIRVAFINYILYYYPKYGEDIHDYVFPAVIYGLVIVLWIIWIKYFVLKKK
jgi:exosortase family protein XrtF